MSTVVILLTSFSENVRSGRSKLSDGTSFFHFEINSRASSPSIKITVLTVLAKKAMKLSGVYF